MYGLHQTTLDIVLSLARRSCQEITEIAKTLHVGSEWRIAWRAGNDSVRIETIQYGGNVLEVLSTILHILSIGADSAFSFILPAHNCSHRSALYA
jgi:hypothetical protein